MSLEATIFVVAYTSESVVVCIGNAFTIFVFRSRRQQLKRLRLKRTYLLLVTLAVADLLVGVTTSGSLITKSYQNLLEKKYSSFIYDGDIFTVLSITFGCTSVFCLVVLSLERVYSVLWPFRHRVIKTSAYIYSIVLVWVAGILMGTVNMLTITKDLKNTLRPTLAIDTALLLSLLIICSSYLIIRRKLTHTASNAGARSKNLKLSKTLSIVIGLSVLCWLPSIVVYIILAFCEECVSTNVQLIASAFNVANSAVNPFVYSYRMTIFQGVFKGLFHNRRAIIEIRALR